MAFYSQDDYLTIASTGACVACTTHLDYVPYGMVADTSGTNMAKHEEPEKPKIKTNLEWLDDRINETKEKI